MHRSIFQLDTSDVAVVEDYIGIFLVSCAEIHLLDAFAVHIPVNIYHGSIGTSDSVGVDDESIAFASAMAVAALLTSNEKAHNNGEDQDKKYFC